MAKVPGQRLPIILQLHKRIGSILCTRVVGLLCHAKYCNEIRFTAAVYTSALYVDHL